MFHAQSALARPQSYKFKMTWFESQPFTAGYQSYDLKVIPGALFCPRMAYDSNAWHMQIQAKDQISGGTNAVKNMQFGGYDQLDLIYSRCSVYKSYMKVTLYSEATQPLIVAYSTRTGGRTGTTTTENGNTIGTLDYKTNISWSPDHTSQDDMKFNCVDGECDNLVNKTQNAWTFNAPSPLDTNGQTGTYTENPAAVGSPTSLSNNRQIKSFIWQQSEAQGGNRVKVIKFPVDHRKFVKNWKLRTAAMSHGSNHFDSVQGDSVVDSNLNTDLLKNYPLMSPVNFLHVAPMMPTPDDPLNARDHPATEGAPNTNNPLGSQPVDSFVKSQLSSLLRVKIELIVEAYCSGLAQEIVDDVDNHNAHSNLGN